MIPGPDADDRYRMVEDELLAVAQRFTTHLHRAEYNRLKAAARAQGEAAIREIERPVVAPPLTATARFRREASRRGARQQRLQQQQQQQQRQQGDAGASGSAAAIDVPWVGTSLQGLMERPRSEARTISSYAPVHPTTRAAAGYHASAAAAAAANAGTDNSRRNTAKRKRELSSRTETTSTASSPAPAVEPSRVATTPRPGATPRHNSSPATGFTSGAAHHARDRKPSQHVRALEGPRDSGSRSTGRERQYVDLDEDDDDPFGVNKRRVRREKSREQMRKPAEKAPPKILSPDTIPSFI
ncbi:MOSC domain containing protein [Purpureocillium lavendulum]|uniref:MOSC domain containing protein n=1 Tax=Purpureocillium lavendulum TaxID=1247861 RepID=A0AB34FZ28_9HYPO|nr:MOSC domain containing protein [Purpureocillium lavendulum]